jgi:hypothetical protein
MKGILIAVVAIVATSALAGVPGEILKAKDSAFNLWRWGDGLLQTVCTGTVIATDDGPRFLTAGHCVEDAPRARYYISQAVDPDYLVRVQLQVWKFNGVENWTDGDFAVFRIPDNFTTPALAVCRKNPAEGEDVWAWTGPIGMLPIIRSGVYSGELHFPDSPEDEAAVGGMPFVDIEGAPGSSGSGMLRLEGGKPCVWGIWVGAFRSRPGGAIVYPVPPFLRD